MAHEFSGIRRKGALMVSPSTDRWRRIRRRECIRVEFAPRIADAFAQVQVAQVALDDARAALAHALVEAAGEIVGGSLAAVGGRPRLLEREGTRCAR